MAGQGKNLVYQTIHKVTADGDFVLVMTRTVVLINRGLSEADVQSHLEGWHASFDNLDRVLSGDAGPGAPTDKAVQR